ncbi:hypothetical protein [Caudoviricetes sp.]|nr:hypothetical protein [Caudoviricetes sp.]
MKLYDVERKSYVRHEDFVELFFDHIDGAYSLCFDRLGNIVHLAAYADVEVIEKPSNWDNWDVLGDLEV